jgi:prepilin-type N-terminal cleavage/methylation domain-containing protein
MKIPIRLRQLRALAGNEQGFSLIEVLVVCLLLSVVLGALMAPIMFTQNRQNQDANYAYAQQRARTGLESIVRQVQQASAILSTGPNSVDMNITLNGSALRVFYECDIPQSGTTYRECVRVWSPQGTALPSLSTGTAVVQNLLNGTAANPVFSFAPDPVAPYYMTATIEIPASGGANGGLNTSVRFDDGALMRNLNIGN